MKIGFIKKKFALHGGAERYLQTLVRSFLKEGHEIHIFANKWADEEGVRFHKVGIIPVTSFLSVTSFNRNCRKALEKTEPMDCVISLERTTCQDIYRAGEGCHAEWLAIRSQREPFHKRLSFRINPLHRSMLAIEKRLFTETKRIVANSEMVKRQIMKHYAVPEERITVIYNGVDLERFCPENRESWRQEVRERLKIDGDTQVLLFVGSGFERKGLPVFIDALAKLKDREFKAMVIGKGDSCTYRSITRDKGIGDKIVFIEPKKEIEKFYAAADLFVLPTLYDPFSNATIEAMASGLPVITSQNNGAAEIIQDGQEGYVLRDLSDAEELAEKISLSLEDPFSMGMRARKRAEEFPIEEAVTRFIGLIEMSKKG
ncbi:MAG: glycosyltransferase family 4 protein [Thermodesulfovibrionales bacterium]|jgi:UDP-glucose:(heptosyl)LPS alpha-1,3-glucosyltransferase